MDVKREHPRYLIKLPVEIRTGDNKINAITVRVSVKGLFARSQACFRVGTPVDMDLYLTDEISCKLKGIVRYARNMVALKRQNGMGIEFTETAPKYREFMRSVEQEKG